MLRKRRSDPVRAMRVVPASTSPSAATCSELSAGRNRRRMRWPRSPFATSGFAVGAVVSVVATRTGAEWRTP